MNNKKWIIKEMGKIGENIRILRTQYHLTLKELASKAKVSFSQLSRVERGEGNPSLSFIEAIAHALNVPVIKLYGESNLYDESGNIKVKELPFFGNIPAGPPDECVAELGSFPVLAHLWKPNRYTLQISSDSMEPTFKAGDVVLVEYKDGWDPEMVVGKPCVVWYNGGNTLKRLKIEKKKGRPKLLLVADNPKYEPIVLSDYTEYRIQGIVIGIVFRTI